MTVQTVPYALQNASHSAALFRQATSAPFQTPGILGVGELAVSQQGTPNMSVLLGPGRGKVAGTQVSPPAGLSFTTQAMYDVLNDANVTLTVTTSNPSNPRIDAVYIGVQDAFYSGASNTALAGIVAGTPGASPVAPAIPANSLLVAYIAVGANVTSIVTANITMQATLAGVIGAVDSGWLDATALLTSGWSSYQPTTYGTAAYRKIGSLVLLRGVIQAAAGAAGGNVFTLPIGYRPPFTQEAPIDKAGAYTQITIGSNGVVSFAGSFGVGATFAISQIPILLG